MKRLTLLFIALLLGGCATQNKQLTQHAFNHAAQVKGTAAVMPAPTSQMDRFSVSNLKPAAKPPTASLEGGLWMELDRIEAGYRTSGKRIKDVALQEYIKGITCRLAGQYCADIRLYIMRVPHFNANMAPNGAMQVWSGLLLRARNEAQLAAVLGHELGHYLRRHSMQHYKTAVEMSNGMTILSLALAYGGAGNYTNTLHMIGQSSLAAYSRDHEREADGYGLRLLVDGGYDPREAYKIWQNLIAEKDAGKGRYHEHSLFASHPPSEERQSSLQTLAEAHLTQHAAGEIGQSRYQRALTPWIDRLIQDEVDRESFASSDQLFEQMANDRFFKARALFARGELRRVRGEKEDYEAALSFYKKALETAPEYAPTYQSMGVVLRRLKRTAEAKAAYRTYLDKEPQAEGAAFIRRYLGES
uniref:Peptidase M48 domain-containing protein n=1 Tax=Magnetococcus massalia (strain MO-1) TaxID=451514 RepID=A0A1S7LM28_MAGMO|nr:Conserved exported protein of unknown function [Candidatus Magnetococcus massalia]